MLNQEQVSSAKKYNYIPQILWDAITCPCPWYLLPVTSWTVIRMLSVNSSQTTAPTWHNSITLTQISRDLYGKDKAKFSSGQKYTHTWISNVHWIGLYFLHLLQEIYTTKFSLTSIHPYLWKILNAYLMIFFYKYASLPCITNTQSGLVSSSSIDGASHQMFQWCRWHQISWSKRFMHCLIA